jgi:hypothetical protein
MLLKPNQTLLQLQCDKLHWSFCNVLYRSYSNSNCWYFTIGCSASVWEKMFWNINCKKNNGLNKTVSPTILSVN